MSKIAAIREELKKLSLEELLGRVHAVRRELFSMRLHAATTPLKDKTQFKKMRKEIARVLTYVRQHSNEVQR
jgi:ribosomal protein L29